MAKRDWGKYKRDRRTFLKAASVFGAAVSGLVKADDPDVQWADIEKVAAPHIPNEYDKAVSEGWQALRTLPPMTFPEWADANFWLSSGSSGMPGQWTTYPYQKAIMHSMANDGIRTVKWQKPARFGYTKIITAFIGYNVERKKRNVALWQPTDSDAGEYVQDEVEPMLEDCPLVGAALTVPVGKKDPANTSARKVFKGATLHIKGGKSATNYRRITVDTGILDELDGFDHVIKGSNGKNEGSPVALASIRVTDSVFKKIIMGSTPTVANLSMIEDQLEFCPQVFERYVPCADCGEYQTLEWGGADCDFGMKWKNNDPNTAQYKCKECGHMHDYGDRDEMDENGYWMSHEMYIEDETGEFYYIHNDELVEPPPEDVGFNCNSLISPFITWSETTKEFIEAAKRLKLGENSAMMTWVNTRMGDTFEEFEVERIDPESFLGRRELYNAEVPLPVVAMTASVDVQIDRVEVLFGGWGHGEEFYAIHKQVIIGDTSEIVQVDENGKKIEGAPDTIWCKLDELLMRTFMHESGQQMRIQLACIDSGYMTDQVYLFCRRRPTMYIPVKGSSEGMSHPIVKFPEKRNSMGVFLTMVGPDNCQDTLHTRYEQVQDGPGKMHFPLDDDRFGLSFFTGMLIEVRMKKIRGGKPVMTWVCPPNGRNENADLMKYLLASVKIIQYYKGINLSMPTFVTSNGDNDSAVDAEAAMIAYARKLAERHAGG